MRVHPRWSAFLLLLLALAPAAHAQSLWNAEGIGSWNEPFDLAARGQGGTSIGRIDAHAMSAQNPASPAWLSAAQAGFGILIEDSWASSDAGSGGRSSDTRIPGIRVGVPLPRGTVLMVGFRDLTTGSYRSRETLNRGREDALERSIEGSGGLGLLSVTGAARLLRSRLAIGVEVGAASGTLRERINDDFVSGQYLDGRNVLRTRYLGGSLWNAGVQARLGPRLDIGAFYGARSRRFDVRSILETRSGVREEHRGRQSLPAGFGLGMSTRLARRLNVSFDWVRRNWSESTFESVAFGTKPGGIKGAATLEDTDRFAVGMQLIPPERSPKDPLLSRSTYRLGFATSTFPVLQAGGREVEEWTVSSGIGLPVQVDRGSLDVSLEVGRRGSKAGGGLQESIARIGVGITFARLRSAY